MILGALSDSHGDAETTRRAIALLESRGATFYIHCGDLCGDGVLDELAGLPGAFVWGNCDSPTATTRRYAETLGLALPAAAASGRAPVELEFDGHRIAVFHGHERAFADDALLARFEYVFYGHTHRHADRRLGGCRLINPGALHRARPRTCATLDLAADALTFLRVDTGEPV